MPLLAKDKVVTVGELIQYGIQLLTDSETARLDCEILLCNVLKQPHYFLYAHSDAVVEQHHIADFNSLISKRAEGFPVAYLIGEKEFWSLRLQVNQHTLIPRPETELLVEQVLALIENINHCKILDLGTGSGAIALAIARERPDCSVTAIDISLPTLAMAQHNAGLLGIRNVQFVHSDWFASLASQSFDLIVSNPPYVESNDNGFIHGEIRYEPRVALDGGRHGLDAYRRIIPGSTAYLKSGGKLLFEHGHTQGALIRELLHANRFIEILTSQDYAGLDRITLAMLP